MTALRLVALRAQDAGSSAGLSDVKFHDLRRTSGCRLLHDEGLSMEEVSGWPGHKSPLNTAIIRIPEFF